MRRGLAVAGRPQPYRRPETDAGIEVNLDARKCRAEARTSPDRTPHAQGLANVPSRCVKGMIRVSPRYAAVPSAT